MRRTVLALAMLALLCGCPRARGPVEPATPATPAEVQEAAKATIEQWRQAYEVRSMEGLAKLYPHELDVVVVQEGTALLGWPSVEGMLKDRLARTTAIHIRLKDIQVVSLAPDVASATATMTRELTEGAATVSENGTLTLVLRKIGADWLIAVEHYSYKRKS
jgi:ketosteroid isomerase-like protein